MADNIIFNSKVSAEGFTVNGTDINDLYANKEEVETTIGNKVDKVSGKGLSTNDYTTTEKNKLSGIASGAEVNQNAFSNVMVGSTTIAADSKTDSLTIAAGTGISVSGDATNDKVTISNSGVRSISMGSSNGTISVNTNGASTDVAVKGLGSAAYTNSSAYDAAGTAQSKADNALNSAKSYTDTKISNLINSAPTTLDTLGEIATAMEENADVVDALEDAIGTKANASDLTSHTGNKSNPHGVTKAQVGLGNVENKSSATIRGELTKANVTTALGYTPPTTDTTYGAAGNSLGLVKSGGDVTISSGVITVNDDSHNHVISNVDGLQDALNGKVNANASTTADLNTVTTSGFYRLSSSNANSPCSNGQLLVIHGGGDTITQIAGSYSTGDLYTRSGNVINNPNGKWTEWAKVVTSNADSVSWTAITQGLTWSRICSLTSFTNVVGCSGILSVGATRGNVVINATFAITASHSKSVFITQLNANGYSPFKIRGVTNQNATIAYIEIYDNAKSIASGTEQTWYCKFIPLLDCSLTKYTAFTTGATIPDGYAAGVELTVDTSGGSMVASKFVGDLSGTATKATQDAAGNTITSTYATNTALGNKVDKTIMLNACDLNDIVTSGFYRFTGDAANYTNRPLLTNTSCAYAQMIVSRGGDTIVQMIFPYDNSEIAIRSGSGIGKSSPNWREWKRVVNNDNIKSFFSNATSSAAGLMSADDKSKLDGIAAGANKYTLPNITNNSVVSDTGTTIAFEIDGKSFSQEVAIDGGSMSVGSAEKLTTARNISLIGDVTGTGSFNGSADLNITATVADDSHNHVISNVDGLQTALDGKAPSEHTHNYAGSSSPGGAATSANKLNTNAGSATQPVYFANGIPVKTTYTLGKSVPSDAKFTDTTYSAASQSAAGLMSAADKKKLDGITESADSVSFSRNLTSGTKVGTITINGTGTDLYAPTNTDTHYKTKLYAGTSGTTWNAVATNPYVKVADSYDGSDTYRNQIRLVGSGATIIDSDDSGNITIASPIYSYPIYKMGMNALAIGDIYLDYNFDHAGDSSFMVNHGSVSYNEDMSSTTHTQGYPRDAFAANSSVAGGDYAFACGRSNSAYGESSFTAGYNNCVAAFDSAAFGQGNYVDTACSLVCGTYSNYSNSGYFVVGKGASENARSNAFRVTIAGQCMGTSTFVATGADYAEYYEWIDGNPDNEDRRGYFVTLDGTKIRMAMTDDDYILGVISGAPAVIGNGYTDEWNGMYLKDIFGEYLTETVEVEETTDKNGVVIPPHTETRLVLNPEYDNTQKYIGRDQRKEWAPVGTHGQLVVIDDGTCEVNGYCKVVDGGTATKADDKTEYRVTERLDDTHIRITIK